MLAPAGVSLGAAWLAVAGLVPWPPVVAVAGWLTVGGVRGRGAHAVVPALVVFGWRRLRHRHRWIQPVPLLTDGELPVVLPPALSGLALYEVDVAGAVPGRAAPMAVIHDRGPATVTAVLRVAATASSC